MTSELKKYVLMLETEFLQKANPSIAAQQKAYMRDQFEYFGLKTPTRRALQKPFLVKDYLPKKDELPELVKCLWEKPQRDFQLFGQDLVSKYQKKVSYEDLEMFEYMITHKSWWDTVDFIAVHLVGSYFKKFPEEVARVIPRWMKSENIWLQRTCIIFQLKCKSDMDTVLLVEILQQLKGSKEFFINKAIGWILREYGKTNPEWVVKFVNSNELSGLSRREATRLIK